MAQEKISYSKAVDEIEEILAKIEQGDLDIDELTRNVRRVTSLLKQCRIKLRKTEEEINRILEEED